MMSWVVGGGGASQTGFGEMMRTRRKMKWTSRWTAIFLFESSNSLRISLFVCLFVICYKRFISMYEPEEKEEDDWYAWMCKLDWPSDHFGEQV